jgi:hemolysin D
MAVTVEIKTGTRRIIDYLLSPILRRSQENLREAVSGGLSSPPLHA